MLQQERMLLTDEMMIHNTTIPTAQMQTKDIFSHLLRTILQHQKTQKNHFQSFKLLLCSVLFQIREYGIAQKKFMARGHDILCNKLFEIITITMIFRDLFF